MKIAKLAIAGFVALAALSAGCAEQPPLRSPNAPFAANQAAHVSIQFYVGERPSGSCAGVIVGANAVLTAAHCAAGKTSAVVYAPNAGGVKSRAHVAWWYDWADQATPSGSPAL